MGTAIACINELTLHARVGSLGTHGIERQVKQWLHKVFRRCVHIVTQPPEPNYNGCSTLVFSCRSRDHRHSWGRLAVVSAAYQDHPEMVYRLEARILRILRTALPGMTQACMMFLVF